MSKTHNRKLLIMNGKFIYPEYMDSHMNKEAKEYIREIWRTYWFPDVDFIMSTSLSIWEEKKNKEHPFKKYK